jgi:spoIIIJ-associated protein
MAQLDDRDPDGNAQATTPREVGDAARVEAQAGSLGEAKWAAMKELEHAYPGLEVEHVSFDVLDESGEGENATVRVAAAADLSAWRAAERDFEWPDDPGERARAIVRRTISYLGVRASVDVRETEEELIVDVSGPELGLLIGKHGQTIDALQFLCSQAAYRGGEDRKQLVVDAGGYRERRRNALERQADRGTADAVRYGRAVELDTMSAQERKVVHNYLKDKPGVDTHSEGDEPFRRIVITPIGQHSGD